MKPRRKSVAVVIALSVLAVAACGWVWFAPSGAGEYADSPDGRYEARAHRLMRGTLFHGRIEYVQVEVVERASGRTVWTAERARLPGETLPDFGDRSRKFIRWAPDSRSVTVPVGASESVWVVP